MESFAEYTDYINEPIMEMANIVKSRHPEMPSNLFISQKNNSTHEPRIKVQNNYTDKVQSDNMFSISISDEPKIIGDTGKLKTKDIIYFINFVKRNKLILTQYWNAQKEIEDVLETLVF